MGVGDGNWRYWRAVGSDGSGGRGGNCVESVESVAQVGHETSAESDVDTGRSGQSDRHFAGALGESGAEAIAGHDRIGR